MQDFDINIYNNHISIIFFDGYIKICSNFLASPKTSCKNNSLAFDKGKPHL